MNWTYLFTSFEGRISRKSYWMGAIVIAILAFVAELLDAVAGTAWHDGGGVISAIAVLVLLYPSIALHAKRWHDRGKSGWWTLIALVPVIGGIWMLVELGFLRGTAGDNQYGPDPLKS